MHFLDKNIYFLITDKSSLVKLVNLNRTCKFDTCYNSIALHFGWRTSFSYCMLLTPTFLPWSGYKCICLWTMCSVAYFLVAVLCTSLPFTGQRFIENLNTILLTVIVPLGELVECKATILPYYTFMFDLLHYRNKNTKTTAFMWLSYVTKSPEHGRSLKCNKYNRTWTHPSKYTWFGTRNTSRL